MKAMKWMAVVLALHGSGCASLPKMDTASPIAIDRGFFAARYKQDGRPIDPSDMREQLLKEPEAEPDVSRAQTLATIAVLLAAAGGGLIGVPLGQAAVGERKPLWPLAGAGAAVFAVSIPLAIWSDSSMDSAVESHNRLVGAREPAAGAGGGGAPPARREAFGFVFGASRTNARPRSTSSAAWPKER